MFKPLIVGVLGCAVVPCACAQPAAPVRVSVQQALSLAEKGHCKEALPVLRSGVAHIVDKQLRLSAAMAQARCGMGNGDYDAAVSGLLQMKRDAPHDPEVLYIWTHYFSQIANRAAQELAETAPDSVQVQKLNAEALESQGKSGEAAAAYRQILEKDPGARDVHYHLAQILLDQPASDQNTEQARHELEEELKVNPNNASVEFILGELARRGGQWDAAIDHFTRASKLDAGFLEAYLALGMSLNSAGRFADAILPLERYVKAEAGDPAGHYQLAMAYARTGNRAAATRESELQRRAAEKAPLHPH